MKTLVILIVTIITLVIVVLNLAAGLL